MSILFGFYGMGLSALQAAQTGINTVGDNIANVNTPGYARRRLDLKPGFPVRVQGGYLSNGVEVSRLNRQESVLIQQNLEREQGSFGEADARLTALRNVEDVYGPLENNGVLEAFGRFSNAYGELAANPESPILRRVAVSQTDNLSRQIQTSYDKLRQERHVQNRSIQGMVDEINNLAKQLTEVNLRIASLEADGTTAAALRDDQSVIIGKLSDLTGGYAVRGERGKVAFYLGEYQTLVTGEDKASIPIQIQTAKDADGMVRLISGGNGADITDRVRTGRLGGTLVVRDETLPREIRNLDDLAADLITRANGLTTGAIDLNGDPGLPLFQPDPPPATGAAGNIAVNPALLGDPSLLAVSGSGAPGDGTAAAALAALKDQPSAALGNRTSVEFFADNIALLGNDVVQADVQHTVSQGLMEDMQTRREEVSGVSLDEEAVNLMKYQSSYQAAARFIKVLNDMTEIAVNMV